MYKLRPCVKCSAEFRPSYKEAKYCPNCWGTRPSEYPKKKCGFCGTVYTPYAANSTYCGDDCRNAGNKMRREEWKASVRPSKHPWKQPTPEEELAGWEYLLKRCQDIEEAPAPPPVEWYRQWKGCRHI